MKIQSYVTIAIRFLALIIILFSARMVFWYFYSGTQAGGHNTLITSLFWLGFSLICWFLPQTIARFICGPVKDTEVKAIDARSFLRMLVIFLGFYFIVNSIFDLTKLFYQLSFYKDTYGSELVKVSLGLVSFQLATGLFLVAKNYWITMSLFKINVPDKPKEGQAKD